MEMSVERIIQTKLGPQVDSQVKEALDEFQERNWRKKNVIVVNLPESKKKDIEDRKQDDMTEIYKIFNKLIRFDEEDLDLMPVRLGRISDRPRMLRATFASEIKVRELVKQAREKNHLLNPGVQDNKNKMYINRDFTEKEREIRKSLYEEKKFRESKGETNLQIRGTSIVQIAPKPHFRSNQDTNPATQALGPPQSGQQNYVSYSQVISRSPQDPGALNVQEQAQAIGLAQQNNQAYHHINTTQQGQRPQKVTQNTRSLINDTSKAQRNIGAGNRDTSQNRIQGRQPLVSSRQMYEGQNQYATRHRARITQQMETMSRHSPAGRGGPPQTRVSNM